MSKLLKNGYEVMIVDNISTGIKPEEWIPAQFKSKYKFFNMDVREFFRNGEESRFSDVFHLAAVVGGRLKIDKDPIAVAQDLSIDAEFFNWLVKGRSERVLYASSSAAYPVDLQVEERHVELLEDMISFDGNMGRPDMTYGWSKLTGEYLSRIASKYYGVHIGCVRPFSGYGEDQDRTYPVPAITQRAVNREDPLIVWGSGRQGRDFVHIEDCVNAMLLTISKISDGSAINISSGRLTTFIEVAKIVAAKAGYNPTITTKEDMPEGVYARYGSRRRAKERLGWVPKVTLEQGLGRVFDYLGSETTISELLNS